MFYINQQGERKMLFKGKKENKEEAQQWFYKGQDFAYQKRYRDALACYEKALQLNPNDGGAKAGRRIVMEAISRGEGI